MRAFGQGWRPAGLPPEVTVLNIDPVAFAALPVAVDSGRVGASVRVIVPSKLAGNGIGRPAAGWDLDLQLSGRQQAGGPDRDRAATAAPEQAGERPDHGSGAAGLLLGDLIAVSDLDARWNMGYRRGWLTVGVVVHGGSPMPGHGPGMTPILTGPASVLQAEADPARHAGLTEAIARSFDR